MATKGFEATARGHDGVAVIDLRGDIDAGAEETLNGAYAQAAAANALTILLNFGGVEYINSTGIALIVSVLARARKERRTVAAYGLTDHYREIFEITRLSDFMNVYADEASAVGST